MSEQLQPVLVVGAGPTGLMLAEELALAGVPVKILEKRAQESNLTRAFGVSARTLELLDARGMADQVLARGHKVSGAAINAGVQIDLTRIDSRYNHALIVPQSGTEDVLEQRVRELGVPIERGARVVGLTQDEEGVDVRVDGPEGPSTERASYVVGADGAHSAVREQLGVSFVGRSYETLLTLADVHLATPPGETVFTAVSTSGILLLVPFGDGYHRAVAWRLDDRAALETPPTFEEVRDFFVAAAGTDFGITDARWMTRFRSERRQAQHYRVGRVLLAGDAAHVHSPAGAQGMNTGIGDAMNLGWKLAAELRGEAPSWLLDSYEAERHPVGRQVLETTDRLYRLVLTRSGLTMRVVRLLMRAAASIGLVTTMLAGFLSGIAIAYPARGPRPHRLAGHRAPDVTLGGTRLYEALRTGRFVLAGAAAGLKWADRVVSLTGEAGPGGFGEQAPVMLVRPDGYIAWASDHGDPAEVDAALADWLGIRVRAGVVEAAVGGKPGVKGLRKGGEE